MRIGVSEPRMEERDCRQQGSTCDRASVQLGLLGSSEVQASRIKNKYSTIVV